MLDSNDNQCSICIELKQNKKYCKNEKCKIGICDDCLKKINDDLCPFCRNNDCFTIDINDDLINKRCDYLYYVLNFLYLMFFFLTNLIYSSISIYFMDVFCFKINENCFLCYFITTFNIISILFTNIYYFYVNLNKKIYFFILLFILQFNLLFFVNLNNCNFEVFPFLFLLNLLGFFNYLLYLSSL